MAEYDKFREKIVHLQSDLSQFKVDFLDRNEFKIFADNLDANVGTYPQISITGYFSETIREQLERILTTGCKLRLLCQELDVNNKREKKNLEVLKKLSEKGAEIKINNRLHARFLVAYRQRTGTTETSITGTLIIGSFDFNNECIGKERYDAGIRTCNPDLILSAVLLFDRIWGEFESTRLVKKYP